jgi:hypothetical protein
MALDFEAHRDALDRLCREHGVHRLDLFGSAAGDHYDPDRSDVDFIVEFGADAQAALFAHYFGLKDELEQLFGRQVDLVMAGAMTNPYFIAAAERSRRPVYASPLAQAA